MTKRQEFIFGYSVLVLCAGVLLIAPWPTLDSLLTTHSSPPIQNGLRRN